MLFAGLWVLVLGVQRLVPGLGGYIAESTQVVRNYAAAPFLGVQGQFADAQLLLEEKRALEQENRVLNLQLLALEYVEQENEELRSLLDAPVSGRVLGAVVAWPPHTAYDTLRVRVPHETRVATGSLALGQGMVAIGSVEEQAGQYAQVRLFSSAGVETPVRVGSNGLTTTLVGKGGGSAAITVPQETDVSVGDPVFFPALGNRLIGHIATVTADPTDPIKRLDVLFPKHLFMHTWVAIVEQ